MTLRIKLWIVRKLFVQYGPAMIAHKNHWVYLDPYGKIWIVRPTLRHDCPIEVALLDQ